MMPSRWETEFRLVVHSHVPLNDKRLADVIRKTLKKASLESPLRDTKLVSIRGGKPQRLSGFGEPV